MRRLVKLVLVLLTVCLCASAAHAQITLSGTQTRGVPGRNAKLESKGVNLPKGGTIISHHCDGDWFWVDGPNGFNKPFYKASEAVNFKLPAGGPYYVYPTLKTGQEKASVTIQIKAP